jgi:hypothetical protein
VPRHGLDLGLEDPPGFGLNLLVGQLRHSGGIARQPQPRQTRLSFQ